MPLLKVENLRIYFKMKDEVVKAVDDVSFHLDQGETLGIVGESGSGKSVTNLSLMGLIPQPPGEIVSGTAHFDGVDLLQLSKAALKALCGDKIGMIFQDPMTSLNPFLTVERQLTEVLEIHRAKTRREARREAIQMLERVGIPDAPHRLFDYPHQFSGGMRQRVMIAMAILCKPALLIADEPTTALDVTIQAQILDLLQKLQQEYRMGLILISHNLGIVAGICDRVNILYAGRVVEAGSTEKIFHHPQHPYTKALLQSVPRLDEDQKKALIPIRDQPPDLSHLPSGCYFHPRCDYVIEKCKMEDPPLMALGEGCRSACWRAREL